MFNSDLFQDNAFKQSDFFDNSIPLRRTSKRQTCGTFEIEKVEIRKEMKPQKIQQKVMDYDDEDEHGAR
jgi:hypothetical protein